MKRFSLLIFTAFFTQIAFGQSIFHVSTSGSGNGESWENASNDLVEILAQAQFGDQIWVAAGIYKPTSGSDRNATFLIPDGVALYGGFKGFEKKIQHRHAKENGTILSGEIGGSSVFDNSFSVVTTKNVSGKTIVDGFVITGGNANFKGVIGNPNSSGGGWYNIGENGSSSPTVRNTLFLENYAQTGGAFFNAAVKGNASPKFFNCFFVENRADFAGGAVYNFSDQNGVSNPKSIMCIFDKNRASYGGAVCNFVKSGSCEPFFANSKIQNNSAEYEGGFMKNIAKNGDIIPQVKGCYTSNNRDNVADDHLDLTLSSRRIKASSLQKI